MKLLGLLRSDLSRSLTSKSSPAADLGEARGEKVLVPKENELLLTIGDEFLELLVNASIRREEVLLDLIGEFKPSFLSFVAEIMSNGMVSEEVTENFVMFVKLVFSGLSLIVKNYLH